MSARKTNSNKQIIYEACIIKTIPRLAVFVLASTYTTGNDEC